MNNTNFGSKTPEFNDVPFKIKRNDVIEFTESMHGDKKPSKQQLTDLNLTIRDSAEKGEMLLSELQEKRAVVVKLQEKLNSSQRKEEKASTLRKNLEEGNEYFLLFPQICLIQFLILLLSI